MKPYGIRYLNILLCLVFTLFRCFISKTKIAKSPAGGLFQVNSAALAFDDKAVKFSNSSKQCIAQCRD